MNGNDNLAEDYKNLNYNEVDHEDEGVGNLKFNRELNYWIRWMMDESETHGWNLEVILEF